MISNRKSIAGKHYDVCIVGSGAAGVITALELARLNPRAQILLVEYGPWRGVLSGDNDLDRTIKIPNLVNHHPAEECTNKGLGGTTLTWGGRCVMYDDIDFLQRDVIRDNCTWSTKYFLDLKPFISTASDYFEIGNGRFELGNSVGPIAENFESSVVTDRHVERWSMPTRFGERYRADLANSLSIDVLCNAKVSELKYEATEKQVGKLLLHFNEQNDNLEVTAKHYVLACGAQETTRLLLKNRHIFAALGMIPDALGKYYQGHVSGKIASVIFYGDPHKTDYGFLRDDEGVYIRRRFQFQTSFLVASNLLNTALWLDNPLYYDPSHRSGAMSFMYLAMITPILGKKLAPPAIAHSVTKGKRYKVFSHIMNILRELPKSLWIPAVTFWGRYCQNRKLPGVFLFSPSNQYALHFHAEQIPHRDNCMALSEDGNSLEICYNLTDEDIASVIAIHEKLDSELRACNAGELLYWFEKKDLPAQIRSMSRDGVHQCGTTRIADTPESGVIDSDLNVFGTNNLYVCSSSAFPTSGQANPTFLIGVVAVKLASHLNSKLNAAS